MSARTILPAPIDRLPPDVRALVESTVNLLTMYMPGRQDIEFLVGRNVKAKVSYEGGPITQEVIADTLAHLAFYKKYFPKDADDPSALDSPEKILNALSNIWAEHRAAMGEPKVDDGQSENGK